MTALFAYVEISVVRFANPVFLAFAAIVPVAALNVPLTVMLPLTLTHVLPPVTDSLPLPLIVMDRETSSEEFTQIP